jgi:FhuF-like iron-sulfur protein
MSEELRGAPATEVRDALAAAAELGMYFALIDPEVDQGGWQPVSALYPQANGQLDDLIESVLSNLGTDERRVAGSVFYQGFAARLLSPGLACLVGSGCIPAITGDQLRWRRGDTELIQLGFTPGAGWRGPADLLLGRLLDDTFGLVLEPLASALLATAPLSPLVLHDNVAAAVVSALQLLGPDWRPLAALALQHPALGDDSGIIDAGRPAFVRRSCCLYYRTGGGLCGDCPLPPRSTAAGDPRC